MLKRHCTTCTCAKITNQNDFATLIPALLTKDPNGRITTNDFFRAYSDSRAGHPELTQAQASRALRSLGYPIVRTGYGNTIFGYRLSSPTGACA